DIEGANFDLGIGEPSGIGGEIVNDIDLYLLNSNGDTVGTATGTAEHPEIKTVIASATDQYFLHVQAITGASDYLLAAGVPVCQASATAMANNSDLNIAADFVPGEVIVKFKNTQTIAAASVSSNSRAASVGLSVKAGAPGRNMLMSLGGGAQRQQALATLNARAVLSFSDDKTQLKYETLEAVKALRARDDVEDARPNYIRRPALVPNDVNYNLQWNLPLINLPNAWNFTTGRSDVIVAVIDSGILPDHPDINADRLVAGYDFIRDLGNAADGDGMDDDPTDPGKSGEYHGTHVTGIIAAETNNDTGMAGIAWNVRVMPLRVLGADGGTDYDIEQAVLYAAGLPNDAETTAQTAARVAAGYVADIINLSLGGPTGTTVAPEAYRQAREQGVIIVAAAGNEGSCGLSYPASLEGVVSVSAVDVNKVVTDYSNIGMTVDVAAPGGTFSNGIYSAWAENHAGTLDYTYHYSQGTSMAAPHVAGVAALMKSYALDNGRDLTPQFFDALLATGELTEDLGEPGRDYAYGYGLIDASLAVQAATMDVQELDPLLTAVPLSLHFKTDVNKLQLNLTNGGGGALTVSPPGNLPPWLTISETSVDVDTGLGAYTAQIDRDLLPSQPSVGAIVSFAYEATNAQNIVTTGTLDLPVIVYSQRFVANAGYHYVQLFAADSFDPAQGQVLREIGVAAADGQYRYRINRVPPGRYVIIAGSDLNGNDSIIDAPDAKGDYPYLGRPVEINVGGSHIQGLDFTSGYNLYYGSRTQGQNN
ncbi:MAG: S8 family serine peptidase, partial [Gammaproteobacteria bacterium]